MKTNFGRKGFFLGMVAIGGLAMAVWLAPVAYQANGTIASADDTGASNASYSADCSDAVWPNIPRECLKNVKDDGTPRRVIMIGEARKG